MTKPSQPAIKEDTPATFNPFESRQAWIYKLSLQKRFNKLVDSCNKEDNTFVITLKDLKEADLIITQYKQVGGSLESL
jgi:hypothetical protein